MEEWEGWDDYDARWYHQHRWLYRVTLGLALALAVFVVVQLVRYCALP